jgi:hypothetical protein
VAQLTAAFDSGDRVNLSPLLYWAGWEWTCYVNWNAATGGAKGKTLGMFTTFTTPGLLDLSEEPVSVTADVRMTMASQSHKLKCYTLYSEESRGLRDMQLAPAVPTSAAVAAAQGLHLQGTQLPLTLTVSNVL